MRLFSLYLAVPFHSVPVRIMAFMKKLRATRWKLATALVVTRKSRKIVCYFEVKGEIMQGLRRGSVPLKTYSSP